MEKNEESEKKQSIDMVDKLMAYSFSISTEVAKQIVCAHHKDEYQKTVRDFSKMLRDVLGSCRDVTFRPDIEDVFDEMVQSVKNRERLSKMTNKMIAGLAEKHLNDPEKSIFSPFSDLVDEIVERLINEKRRDRTSSRRKPSIRKKSAK